MTKHEMQEKLDKIDSKMNEYYLTTKGEEIPGGAEGVQLAVMQREALYAFMGETRKLVSIMKELVEGK